MKLVQFIHDHFGSVILYTLVIYFAGALHGTLSTNNLGKFELVQKLSKFSYDGSVEVYLVRDEHGHQETIGLNTSWPLKKTHK